MEIDIRKCLDLAINRQVFPGGIVGVVKTNGERLILPVGHYTYDQSSQEVEQNTIYDMASITKSIPGSTSLLKLIDEGKLNLDDRLVDYVPEFGNFENKKEVKIKHILTYTLDLEIVLMSALKDKNAEEIINLIIHAPLKSPPGSKHIYTNVTAGFIGLIVRKITGQTLDLFANENFFNPLKMKRTTFFPEKFSKKEIVPTEIDDWRGRVIQGEVHDESTFILRPKYITAAAGLFSTAPDILNFLEMLLNKGIKDGQRYFSEEIIAQMHTNQLGNSKETTGLGWFINWPEATGVKCSGETFSKSGFTGTIVVIDPVKNIAFTLLSNRTYPKRPKDSSAIMEVRRSLADIIFSSVC